MGVPKWQRTMFFSSGKVPGYTTVEISLWAYTTANVIRTKASLLRALQTGNILHYGFLTLVAPITKLEQWVNKAKDIFLEFKNVQGNDQSKRTIIAMGTFNYSSAMAQYADLFRRTIAKDYKADVVIVVSSSNIQEDVTSCRVVPPGALYIPPGNNPSFDVLMNMVKKANQYPDKYKIVGLSLEMAALVYRYHKNITTPGDVRINEPCTQYALVPVDVVSSAFFLR
ncbi:hypothetical protein V5799_014152 [Amblyomma americanum]|uniref:Uncharacterized protein n=1 Tax=Amblyomma americanum TaxID=6943 RepID=A0AAQ4E434_AMBAM